jgi:crossover junction endodeoxyribonuclease RuvC
MTGYFYFPRPFTGKIRFNDRYYPLLTAKPNPQIDPDMVLGIDPGTAIMGYGLVRAPDGAASPGDFELVEYGTLTTPAGMPLARRLLNLYGQLNSLLDRFSPSEVVVEELFFNRNTTTAIAVGQARGVALLAAASHNLTVQEYTPLQVKQALAGYGRATKEQVQQMVRVLLDLDYTPQPDDAADALALAICHLRGRRFQRLLADQSE